MAVITRQITSFTYQWQQRPENRLGVLVVPQIRRNFQRLVPSTVKLPLIPRKNTLFIHLQQNFSFVQNLAKINFKKL